MTIWGDAIQVDGVRPDWLREDEPIQWLWTESTNNQWNTGSHRFGLEAGRVGIENGVKLIRLPTDHPYYTATSRGFKYWPGGDVAPSDWDGGTVLLRNGSMGVPPSGIWRATIYHADIIGYKTKQASDTVTLERASTQHWLDLIDRHGVIGVLRSLDLIGEPSEAERIAGKTGLTVAQVQSVLEARDEKP